MRCTTAIAVGSTVWPGSSPTVYSAMLGPQEGWEIVDKGSVEQFGQESSAFRIMKGAFIFLTVHQRSQCFALTGEEFGINTRALGRFDRDTVPADTTHPGLV